MKVSLNTIYKTAIAEYIQKKEIQRWRKGIELASKNREYMNLCEELGEEGSELYEY